MESTIKQIRENWIILCFIVALIVSWTNTNSRLASAENDVEQLSQVVTQINDINIRLGEIQTDLGWIKTRLQ